MKAVDLIHILQNEVEDKGEDIEVYAYNERTQEPSRIDIVDDTLTDRIDLVYNRREWIDTIT